MSLQPLIAEVFEDELGIPREEVVGTMRYGEVPEWDSASHMVVMLALEERFGIEFDSDQIVELTSVDAIEQGLIAKGVAERPDAA